MSQLAQKMSSALVRNQRSCCGMLMGGFGSLTSGAVNESPTGAIHLQSRGRDALPNLTPYGAADFVQAVNRGEIANAFAHGHDQGFAGNHSGDDRIRAKIKLHVQSPLNAMHASSESNFETNWVYVNRGASGIQLAK